MTEATILVAGAGPVGMLAALAVAAEGFPVALVGPTPSLEDRRTTALMLPSLALLDRLGVLARLEAQSAELRTMRIVDATSRLVRAPTVTFRASEIGERLFGLNVPNRTMLESLLDAVAATPAISRHEGLLVDIEQRPGGLAAVLQDGSRVEAALLVAADGRNSAARELAGIAVRRRALPQAALVLNIGHGREHGYISTEFHTETGPFTQVPLPGRRSSIVWVLSPRDAAAFSALPAHDISARIEARMGSMLGKVEAEEGRQVHPLSTLTAERVARARVALVGEAAHVFPPIGAQGLNLGLRDVEDLVRAILAHAGDPGGEAALADYARRRRADILARSAAVNLLNQSLLSELLPAQLARGAGLAMLDAVPGLRGFFMREGLRPGAGFSALAGLLPRGSGRIRERGRAAGSPT